MNKMYAVVTGTFFMLPSFILAADKVVVIPIFGAVGDATVSDVVKSKTFSSKEGKGLTGTMEIREGSTIYTNSIGMKFSLIPAGSFVMGSPDGRNGDNSDTHRPFWPAETGRDSGEIQHVVTISKSFYMQTTEVTQGQWEQVIGSGTNPSYFTGCGMNCPVEEVSWNDAQNFIVALNVREGRTNCDTKPNACYSLPTESQWEYSARAGTVTAFYSGDLINTSCNLLDPSLNTIGWYCGNANNTTHPVAQKEPNTWGLYDMSGNVWEWCQDWYGTYPDNPVTDPSGAAPDSNRVIRGGSWIDTAKWARSASRWHASSLVFHYNYLGFRLVLPPGQ